MPEITHPRLKSLELPDALAGWLVAAPMPELTASPRIPSILATCREEWQNSMGPCVKAGLWLLAGELDRSHELSQSVSSSTGSYWHGIMHRREGDFWNSKYWFRMAGRHPCLLSIANTVADFSQSQDLASLVVSGEFQPSLLTDRFERCLRSHSDPRAIQQVAWIEWQALFSYSWEEGI